MLYLYVNRHNLASDSIQRGLAAEFLSKSNTGWIFLCILYKGRLAEHLKEVRATLGSELRCRTDVPTMLSADR